MTRPKSLRLSVTTELFEQVEYYAKILNTSVAESARLLLAAGATALASAADKEARR